MGLGFYAQQDSTEGWRVLGRDWHSYCISLGPTKLLCKEGLERCKDAGRVFMHPSKWVRLETWAGLG